MSQSGHQSLRLVVIVLNQWLSCEVILTLKKAMQGYNNAAKANTTQISEMTFANGIEAQYNTLISKQQCICLCMLHYVHNMQST